MRRHLKDERKPVLGSAKRRVSGSEGEVKTREKHPEGKSAELAGVRITLASKIGVSEMRSKREVGLELGLEVQWEAMVREYLVGFYVLKFNLFDVWRVYFREPE